MAGRPAPPGIGAAFEKWKTVGIEQPPLTGGEAEPLAGPPACIRRNSAGAPKKKMRRKPSAAAAAG